MAKLCLLCGKKLNMMNFVTIDSFTFCLDCRDKIDLLKNSEDIQTLKQKSDELMKQYLPDSEAYAYLRPIVEAAEARINGYKALDEEAEKQRKEHLEREEQQRQERIRREAERLAREKEEFLARQAENDRFLKENGHEGYYEYKVINILDEKSGGVDISSITNQLNLLGRQGWHLRCAFTNELGQNSSSIGLGGISLGLNSTADQSVLILERFIKFKPEE